MMRLLYRLFFPLAFLVILPRYLQRMLRRGNFRQDFGQRFARYTPGLRERFRHGPWIWVHAVSVGETLIALKLLEELHRRRPDWQFVVSSTTSTAHALALERQQSWWVPIYTPVDSHGIVRRALDTVQPQAIVLTESEMWPGFIWEAARRQIPVALINARVSPRSERRYRRFARPVRAVTRHLAAVGLQEPAHADLWTHLGVLPSRQHLTGSVKYDPAVPDAAPRDFRPVLEAFHFAAGAPVLLGGSTHEGEEDILAAALDLLRRDFPEARLVIAPRHVERVPALVDRLRSAGRQVARRTDPPGDTAPDILMLDTTGELRDWYACAEVVFIGKSLCGHGGQNPVEAILAGKPVLFGPEMQNFASLKQALLDGGGAAEVCSAEDIAASAAALLKDANRRERMIQAAATALAPHRGATARTADLVEKLVMDRDSGRSSG